jgi:hypothetical protein
MADESTRENIAKIRAIVDKALMGPWMPEGHARAMAAEAALEAAQKELAEVNLIRMQDANIACDRIKELERENSTFKHALQQIAKQKLVSEVEDPDAADFRSWHEYSVKLARYRLGESHD